MKVTFSCEGYISSILRVVVLVVCFQGNVSGERVQGCVESELNLRCPEVKMIQITAVVLGDSNCTRASCCIRDGDCTRNANAGHIADVHRNCNEKQSCTVGVLREKISCVFWGAWYSNDFERITYDCVDGPRRVVLLIVIICIVILIVIIAVIASVVAVRRKKKRQVKSSDAVKMSGLKTDKEESVYINAAHGTIPSANVASTFPIYTNTKPKEVQTSLESGATNVEASTSDYCVLEGVDRGRFQCDSEYEQLDHGRNNYEPLIVYEQLRQMSSA